MTWEFCFAIFIAKFEQGTFKKYLPSYLYGQFQKSIRAF